MTDLRSMQKNLKNASVSGLFEITLEQQLFQAKMVRRLARFMFYDEPIAGMHLCKLNNINLEQSLADTITNIKELDNNDNDPNFKRVDDVIERMVKRYADPKQVNDFVNFVSKLVDDAVDGSRKYSMIGTIYSETIFKNVYAFAKSCHDLINTTKEITRFLETRKDTPIYEVMVKLKAFNYEILTKFDNFAKYANVNAENMINFFQFNYFSEAESQKIILDYYHNLLSLWLENPYFNDSNMAGAAKEIENDKLTKSLEKKAAEEQRIQALYSKRAEESELNNLNGRFGEIKYVSTLLSKYNEPKLNIAAQNLELGVDEVENKHHFPLSALPKEEAKAEVLADLDELTKYVNRILAELGYHVAYGINDIRTIVNEYFGSGRKAYFLDDGMNQLNENLNMVEGKVDPSDLSIANAAGIITSYMKIVGLYDTIQNMKEGTHYPEVQDLFSKQ